MSQSGRLQVYPSRAGGHRGYRWRRVVNDSVADRSDRLYVTAWSAARGARRACPGIDAPVEHVTA